MYCFKSICNTAMKLLKFIQIGKESTQTCRSKFLKIFYHKKYLVCFIVSLGFHSPRTENSVNQGCFSRGTRNMVQKSGDSVNLSQEFFKEKYTKFKEICKKFE